jgi:hypothetical protein
MIAKLFKLLIRDYNTKNISITKIFIYINVIDK